LCAETGDRAASERGKLHSHSFGGRVRPGTFTNQVTVAASNGGTLTAAPTTTLTNLTGSLTGSIFTGMLAGGTWQVGASSTLRLGYQNDATKGILVGTNAANIVLDGGNSRLLGGLSGSNYDQLSALMTLSANTGAGSLTIRNGHSLADYATFTNSGSVTVGTGSTLFTPGPVYARYSAEGNTNDRCGANNAILENGVGFAAGVSGQGFSFGGINDFVRLAQVSTPRR